MINCINCQSTNTFRVNRDYPTNAYIRYVDYKCNDCGIVTSIKEVGKIKVNIQELDKVKINLNDGTIIGTEIIYD